jgi:hypothetical protein
MISADIIPNDPDLMASKAGIYQAEGSLSKRWFYQG